MILDKNTEASLQNHVWVISRGRSSDFDMHAIGQAIPKGPVWEYRISDLARYMLNPNPIEVQKKLIGCQVYYRLPFWNNIKENIRRLLPQKLHGMLKIKDHEPEVLLSNSKWHPPSLKDKRLESHVGKILELRRTYDTTVKRLSELDPGTVADIIGVCQDVEGNQSLLNLQGSLEEKIQYIGRFILKDVGVIIAKSYIANGLFEMSAFDFDSYAPHNTYRLIKFFEDGKARSCVLGAGNKVEYWVDDVKLLHFMHLLEQSIQVNPVLRDSLDQCAGGNAGALKIFFNKQLAVNYSPSHTPEIYRRAFQKHKISAAKREAVIDALNSLQLAISFNYTPQSPSNAKRLCTNISVMHDFKALEPLKNNLPQLYADINQEASVSEAGKFYLLDCIKGYRNGK